MKLSDTIAAIATPLGEGAISVVRVSGPDALALADRVFRGNHTLSETPGFTIRYGRIVDSQHEQVDQVLASVFRSPNSYTGEDSVEISCHGGVFVTRRVLSTLIQAGARQADPGEFTRRAFLNNKMDLSQAEAVADLIHSGSERALRNSSVQLSGALAEQVHSIKSGLLEICSLVEIQLDFSEEDITPESSLERRLVECRDKLQSLMSSFRIGKILRDGVSVAIVGRPNVGKSSLFNRLLVAQRSIVSSVPGTTRDFLEESIVIDGSLVKLTDTAGIRLPGDEVEAEGIQRTKEVVRMADIVLLVIDATEEPTAGADLQIIGTCVGESTKVLLVDNKVDQVLPDRSNPKDSVPVSALTGFGIDRLRDKIRELAMGDSVNQDSGLFICSTRHTEAIRNCLNHIDDCLKSLKAGVPGDFVAADLRMAIDSLSLITGEITNDDILNTIFSSFCIGK